MYECPSALPDLGNPARKNKISVPLNCSDAMGDTPDDRELEKRMLLFVAVIIGLGIAILGFIG